MPFGWGFGFRGYYPGWPFIDWAYTYPYYYGFPYYNVPYPYPWAYPYVTGYPYIPIWW